MSEHPAPVLPEFDPSVLLDALPDGLYITDVDRRILYWNRAAERITGWDSGEVVGRSCFDNILGHVDKDGHCLCGQEHCPLHRSIVTGEPSEEPLLVFARCKSGRRVPVEVTVAPLRNRLGETVGGIEVFRDATAGVADLLRAKTIQDLSLGGGVEDDPRFEVEVCHEPREVVGGDFHRVERLDDGRLGLLVADVMGHGVASALYTMQLAALWDGLRGHLGEPARFCGLLNERLHLVVADAGFFATAVCAVYQPDDGAVSVVLAGHPAPLIFRAAGDVESLGKPRPALGMLPDMEYEEYSGVLGPGDELLLFSDGAIEVPSTDGGELGVEGLKRIVGEERAEEPAGSFSVERIEERLLRFSNRIHLPDDLTLLRLRRPC